MKEDVVFHLEDNNANDDGPSFFDGVIMRCNNKALRDENLDEIIKELETSSVLREVYLQQNQISLADGRFMAALASNTSLLKINLHGNKIGDEGARRLASALKVVTQPSHQFS
jgi:Ran GTPase-activating protein (RanGAP) involved in mRNA processing and transport